MEKKVVAVLPAYNAAKTINQTYEAIPKEWVDEIIMVDDASHDDTVKIANQISNLLTFVHEKNRGYGANQKTCYSKALERDAEVVVMVHADFQYDPAFIPQLIAPILNGDADMVIGSRFLGNDPRRDGMNWWRYWGNRFLTTIQNRRLSLNLSECHSGYRAYSRKLLQSVPFQTFSDDFVFDSEMIATVAQKRLSIHEVAIPTRYTSQSSSISLLASIRYGVGTLRTVLNVFKRQEKEKQA